MNNFFIEFCKNPRKVGSIIPSSGKMINKMLSKIDFSKKNIIAEFGFGTGNFTKKILEKMTHDSFLYSFEVLEELYSETEKKIKDSRLDLINDGAENIEKYFGENKLDVIISGIPLATIPSLLRSKILDLSYKSLKNGGIFLQYQYFLTNKNEVKSSFEKFDLFFEIFNIPPAFYYKCEKKQLDFD